MALLRHKRVFEMLCLVPSKLGVIPMEWQSQNVKLSLPDENRKYLISAETKLHIQYINFLVILLQGIFYFKRNPSDFSDIVRYALVIMAMLIFCFIQKSCVRGANSQCLYINGIIKMSEGIGSTKRVYPLKEKLDLLYGSLLAPNVFVIAPIFVYGLHWMSPCKPSLSGYMLIPECRDQVIGISGKIINFGAKLVVFIFNHLSWMAGIHCAAYANGGILVLCVMSFHDFLLAFSKMVNSDEKVYKAGEFYRQIQYLNILCNEVQASVLIVVIVFGGALELTVCSTAVCLVPWTKENLFWLMLFGLCMGNMIFLVLICAGCMAESYVVSLDILSAQKKRMFISVKYGKEKYVKWKDRFYWSCTPVTFKIGKVNFVDKFTALNLLAFAFGQTVNLLIMGKN